MFRANLHLHKLSHILQYKNLKVRDQALKATMKELKKSLRLRRMARDGGDDPVFSMDIRFGSPGSGRVGLCSRNSHQASSVRHVVIIVIDSGH